MKENDENIFSSFLFKEWDILQVQHSAAKDNLLQVPRMQSVSIRNLLRLVA